MATLLRLEIITAEQVTHQEEVDAVIAPGIAGQLTILPNHAPLMTMIEPGELTLRKGNEETFIAVTGGYLEVLDNKVLVLADAAEHAEEIDVSRAERAKQRAEEMLRSGAPSDIDQARVEAALRRSLARLKVAERRRRREKRTI